MNSVGYTFPPLYLLSYWNPHSYVNLRKKGNSGINGDLGKICIDVRTAVKPTYSLSWGQKVYRGRILFYLFCNTFYTYLNPTKLSVCSFLC